MEEVRAAVPGSPPVSEVAITGEADTALAQDCLRRATCPVVVVPPART